MLPVGEPVPWREYELTAHALPGHTRYAAALELQVDGKRVLATGDQQTGLVTGRSILNYQYRNRFAVDDYVRSAELYERLQPDLVLTGHWGVQELPAAVRAQLARDGRRVAELHRELLPLRDAEGFPARLTPYRSTVRAGDSLDLTVDATRLTGAATVALRQHPAIGARLAIDQLNLDAYLPAAPAAPARDQAASGYAALFDAFQAPSLDRTCWRCLLGV